MCPPSSVSTVIVLVSHRDGHVFALALVRRICSAATEKPICRNCSARSATVNPSQASITVLPWRHEIFERDFRIILLSTLDEPFLALARFRVKLNRIDVRSLSESDIVKERIPLGENWRLTDELTSVHGRVLDGSVRRVFSRGV